MSHVKGQLSQVPMLADELKKIVSGDVITDRKALKAASEDASIFKLTPEVIVAPKNSKDIEEIINFVSSERKMHTPESVFLSITARSGGTDMSGGPLSSSIVLDMTKYLTGIVSINKGAKAITVLPGTYYRDVHQALEEKDLLYPSYPASWRVCTIGGIVANNSGGEKSLVYGKTENYVRSLKMVFSDGVEREVRPLSKSELQEKKAKKDFEGNVYRDLHQLILDNEEAINDAKPQVSKNSAGYYLWNVWDREKEVFDLTKLIVGSQGTLGIITEATLGLVKPRKHSTLLVIFLKDLQMLATIIRRVLSHNPESFESYDNQTMKVAMRFLPQMFKLIGAKNLFALGIKFLPELGMVLTGGIPKLVLVAEFTGDSEEEIYEKAKKAQADLEDLHIKTRITKDDLEESKYWTMRRQSFALLREHVHGKHTAPFIDDIVVPPQNLGSFLPELEEIMSEYDITYTVAGHVGDGNFHIIPLMNYKRPDFREIIEELSDEVYRSVLKHGGSIDGEHNDGLIRTPYLEMMYGTEIVELFAQVKKILDPLNILNPGKKVPDATRGGIGTLNYAFSHIRPD